MSSAKPEAKAASINRIPETWKVAEFMATLRAHRKELRERYDLRTIGVFGSYLHNAQKINSDLDILVEFEKPPSFFQFLRIEQFLSELLGVKVDLVMKESLKPNIGRHILQEIVYT